MSYINILDKFDACQTSVLGAISKINDLKKTIDSKLIDLRMLRNQWIVST